MSSSWWFQPTHLKNMLVKMGSSSPSRDENKNYIWNHLISLFVTLRHRIHPPVKNLHENVNTRLSHAFPYVSPMKNTFNLYHKRLRQNSGRKRTGLHRSAIEIPSNSSNSNFSNRSNLGNWCCLSSCYTPENQDGTWKQKHWKKAWNFYKPTKFGGSKC